MISIAGYGVYIMSDPDMFSLDSKKLIGEITKAMDDLPILARLKFVTNLLCDKGGEKDALMRPVDPTLVTAVEVLRGVVNVIETHPRFGSLSSPAEPRQKPIPICSPEPKAL